MIDLLIRNGIVVTNNSTFSADLAIKGEKIYAIGECGSFREATVELDARGKYVIPGLIDPHVHMAHPFRDKISDDDFYTTTVSAAHGGTTTIIDFAIQWDKSKNLAEIIEHRRKQAEKDVVIDFGLHGTPTKSSEETIQAVADAIQRGVPSFKVYMIYRNQGRMVDDAVLYGLLKEMGDRNGLLMVHAENASIAEFNQENFLAKGCNRSSDFPSVKPNLVEAEAINRAIFLNRIAHSRLYIAHLSTREGLALVREAQGRGESVLAETCPHYLTLTEEAYNHPGGERFICSPPLRSRSDIDNLWVGIADGSIALVSSDHCGFGLGQKNLGDGDFSKTPHGLPGIETRLPVIFTEGVLKKRITINKMVEVLSTNAAKIFGLYPKKGGILPGSDADITVLDPNQERVISAAQLHGAVDWTPYEGMKAQGFASLTILRGKIITMDGNLYVSKGFGKYIPREIHKS